MRAKCFEALLDCSSQDSSLKSSVTAYIFYFGVSGQPKSQDS